MGRQRRAPVPSSENAFRLDGKLALVTGAGRGIGRAVALALAAAGAELLLNSRTPAELHAVAAEIDAQGGRASPEVAYYLARVLADKGNTDDARRLLQSATGLPGSFAHREEAQSFLKTLAR